jgi:LmbE family N-acetylglucosaminyl deacetylase
VTVKPDYKLPSASKMAKKSQIKPIAPDYKLKLSISEAVQKIKALKAHRSQFKINLFQPQVILFFLMNDMLFHEYYTYKSQ